jgi:hypothetical protein
MQALGDKIAWVAVLVILAAVFISLSLRAIFISKNERRVRGLWWTSLLFFKRELILIRRGWKAVAFHIAQLIFGGLFIGVLFYGHPYKGPIVQLNDREALCPTDVTEVDVRLVNSVCMFLSFPEDDVIMPLASLNALTMALCAIAYAIPVFGGEIAVFKRESSVGVSTGAYYIGKTAAHFLVSAFAPLIYLLSFGALAPIKAQFWEHYLILLITHLTFSGAGYTLSLIVPPALGHLLGVFFVLSNMMFSGANPTLKALQTNALFGRLLYYPSYLSYLRWVMELFYITEITPYKVPFAAMSLFFDFSPDHLKSCWSAVVLIMVIFRAVPLMLLYYNEN